MKPLVLLLFFGALTVNVYCEEEYYDDYETTTELPADDITLTPLENESLSDKASATENGRSNDSGDKNTSVGVSDRRDNDSTEAIIKKRYYWVVNEKGERYLVQDTRLTEEEKRLRKLAFESEETIPDYEDDIDNRPKNRRRQNKKENDENEKSNSGDKDEKDRSDKAPKDKEKKEEKPVEDKQSTTTEKSDDKKEDKKEKSEDEDYDEGDMEGDYEDENVEPSLPKAIDADKEYGDFEEGAEEDNDEDYDDKTKLDAALVEDVFDAAMNTLFPQGQIQKDVKVVRVVPSINDTVKILEKLQNGFQNFVEPLAKKLTPKVGELVYDIELSPECMASLLNIGRAIQANEPWAMRCKS